MRIKGIFLAGIGAILWGFSGACGQTILHTYNVPVGWLTCARQLFSAVLLFLAVALTARDDAKRLIKDPRSLLAVIIFGAIGVFGAQYTYFRAISYTNAGTATVLEQLAMVIVLSVGCFRDRRLPRAKELLAVCLAMAGVVVISTQGNLGSLSMPLEGLVWGLAGSLGLALYTLIPVNLMKQYSPTLVAACGMFFGGLINLALERPWSYSVVLPPEGIATMAAMIVFGSVLSYLMYLHGITYCGPVFASLIGSLEPVSATVLATLWLRTPLSLYDIAGCALVIAMIFILSFEKAEAQSADKAGA